MPRHEGSHRASCQRSGIHLEQTEGRGCAQTRRIRGNSVGIRSITFPNPGLAFTRPAPPPVQLCPVRRRPQGGGEDVRPPDQRRQTQRSRDCQPAEAEDSQYPDQQAWSLGDNVTEVSRGYCRGVEDAG